MGKAVQIIAGIFGLLVLVSIFGGGVGLTVDSVIDGTFRAISIVATTTVAVIPKLIDAVSALFA